MTKWEWYASQNQSPGDFNKFTLKHCHTSLTTLTDTYTKNYDGKTPVQVYYRDPARIAATPFQWFGFTFDKAFAYNGTDNLLFEVWWVGDNNGNAYTFWTPKTGRYVYSYIKGSTAYNGYPNKGLVVNYLHYMRITISASAVEASSLGRVRALYR
ncbi:MAG: hypothetical protein V3T41_08455 [bacterium]